MNVETHILETLSRSIHGAWAKCSADSPASSALYHAVCTIDDILKKGREVTLSEADYKQVIRDYGVMYQTVDNLRDRVQETIRDADVTKTRVKYNERGIGEIREILDATLIMLSNCGNLHSIMRDQSEVLHRKLIGEEDE